MHFRSISYQIPRFWNFPRRLHGLEPRYLSGLRPGRPNSDKSGFPGRTEKLCAEKSCRLMVVSHRVLHFSSLLCPFKIVDFQLILLISGAFHLRIRPSECTLNLSVNRMSGSLVAGCEKYKFSITSKMAGIEQIGLI